jgi:hypothetical protein
VSALRELFSRDPEFLDFFIYKNALLGSGVSSLVFCSPEAMGMEKRLLFQAGMDFAYKSGGLFLPAALQHWSNESWRVFVKAIISLQDLDRDLSSNLDRKIMWDLEDIF